MEAFYVVLLAAVLLGVGVVALYAASRAGAFARADRDGR